jgi:hypothetical protein
VQINQPYTFVNGTSYNITVAYSVIDNTVPVLSTMICRVYLRFGTTFYQIFTDVTPNAGWITQTKTFLYTTDIGNGIYLAVAMSCFQDTTSEVVTFGLDKIGMVLA